MFRKLQWRKTWEEEKGKSYMGISFEEMVKDEGVTGEIPRLLPDLLEALSGI